MPLTILSDEQINSLLHSLTREDIEEMQKNLATALHDYSTGTQDTTTGCSANQPERISISDDNKTTLFMPATTGRSIGVKIVSLTTPPSASSASDGGTISKDLAASLSTKPRGSLTLLNTSGVPFGFLSATTLTAFRTALASTMLFKRRRRVHTIVVFGAGAQAYWAIRLVLMLRGEEIHHIHIINRSFEGAEPLLRTIYRDHEWAELRNANDKLNFSILSSEYGDYGRLLSQRVRDADAIFMCTPSTEPLFPAEVLTGSDGKKKGRYISLIGSYQPHMMELHPDVLRLAVKSEDHKRHFHKHAERSGVVVVDSLSACLREAGEIIAADLHPEQLAELGELVMVRRMERKEAEGGGEQSGLVRWVESGLVIYKSVGLGIMDLCVGADLVELARTRGVGTTVDDI